MVTQLFTSDFENTIITGRNLGWTLPSGVSLGTYLDYVGFTPAIAETTDGVTPHSGVRMLKWESLTPTGATRRGDLNIFLANILPLLPTNEWFVSCWRYIPTDFRIPVGNTARFSTLFQDGDPLFYPYVSLGIANPSGTYYAQMNYRDIAGVFHDNILWAPITLPLGRWFEFAYYVRRSTTNGALAVYFDGVEIFNRSGYVTDPRLGEVALNTQGIGVAPYTNLFGIGAGATDATVPLRQWLDDFTIYDGIPTGGLNVTLNIQGTPINIPVNIDGVDQGNTPISLSYPAGSNHTIAVPAEVVV